MQHIQLQFCTKHDSIGPIMINFHFIYFFQETPIKGTLHLSNGKNVRIYNVINNNICFMIYYEYNLI